MNRAIADYIARIDPTQCDSIEVSGDGRAGLPWRSYRSVSYPEFDLLDPPDIGTFDVVVCEQVLEHVDDPITAMRTLAALCRPGGHVIVSTPFMLRIHPAPVDHWRFTPAGLQRLVESSGLRVTQVDSWGNAWCIRRNRRSWAVYRWWHRLVPSLALRNDPAVPQVVWAFARRDV